MNEPTPIEPPQPKSIDEIKKIIKNIGLNPGSESYNRKMLIEGLEYVKNKVEYNNRLKEAENHYIKTEDLGGGWIAHFVRDTMGGEINPEDQTIVWHIDGKDIKFNPSDGTVEYVE